ncbi:MAG: NUDIX domain-containing protein [Pseudomonadota bacterium]
MTELFDTYTADGQPLGTMARDEVHRNGVWHRAVNVFLFNASGALLIQQRAAVKDVCPLKWDLSVAEHLQPGESYLDAAYRGIREELGLDCDHLVPLGSPTTHQLLLPEQNLRNCEFTQCYRGEVRDDMILDPSEVADCRYVDLTDLREQLTSSSHLFTPWFIDLVQHVDLC